MFGSWEVCWLHFALLLKYAEAFLITLRPFRSWIQSSSILASKDINIAPSSIRARLDTFTLSCALTYHLLQGSSENRMCQVIVEQMVLLSMASDYLTEGVKQSFLAPSNDVYRLEVELRASGGNVSRLPDAMEVSP